MRYGLLLFALLLMQCGDDESEGSPSSDMTDRLMDVKNHAHQGSPSAAYDLGIFYGKSGEKNSSHKQDAVFWLRMAADRGHKDAQYRLGLLYAHGKDVPLNQYEAVAWWRAAARQGHREALFHVGLALANGNGAILNQAAAAEFYKEAALMGHTKAQVNLALLFFKGEGVKRNWVQAAALLSIIDEARLEQKQREQIEQLRQAIEKQLSDKARSAAIAESQQIQAIIDKHREQHQ